jgi:hypothetical protein
MLWRNVLERYVNQNFQEITLLYYIDTCASEVHNAVKLILSTEESENYRNGVEISGRILVSIPMKIRHFFQKLQNKGRDNSA